MTELESIELLQPILGMQPYVLIEAGADPADGELVLKVNAGGGAKDVGTLPMLLLMELAADQNPLTMAIREHLADHPGDREALARFADTISVPMPEAPSD